MTTHLSQQEIRPAPAAIQPATGVPACAAVGIHRTRRWRRRCREEGPDRRSESVVCERNADHKFLFLLTAGGTPEHMGVPDCARDKPSHAGFRERAGEGGAEKGWGRGGGSTEGVREERWMKSGGG